MPEKGIKLTENPRTIRFQIRLTAEEAATLEATARRLSTTKSAVLLKGLKIVSEKK